ncbi:COMPASS (complex proteins associated with Set1p) component, variant 2 [Salvia divinorum]|uniref:COMPASS (Complex proteins associated with Set1p) component, variant 2 n=1 Tax=Salvia divinorum TaxID=28513 RepID=A0ABD1HA05_SALDI
MAAPCQNFLLGISSFDAHNILGLVFSIQAGLFVYDIFWVFFTPVMLLFPTSDFARPFSILGLGDIVIPGIFVVLALRCDFSRGKDRQYFKSAFLGYIYCWSDRHNHRNELVSSCTSD